MATVSVTSLAKYQILVRAAPHAWVSDEPAPEGDDMGPGPYELLLSALGSCTATTLLMYARRKGWPLEEVRVTLSHQRIHAQDCRDCEADESGRVDLITREIQVKGQLSQEQRDRLLSIATRCPVHKTLTHRPKVVDSLEALP
ncbi:MAG: OsmC family protein [Dehalococcoidia bacterium]|nr:OsmC family protein [Dehalococcoidia bacterium]